VQEADDDDESFVQQCEEWALEILAPRSSAGHSVLSSIRVYISFKEKDVEEDSTALRELETELEELNAIYHP